MKKTNSILSLLLLATSSGLMASTADAQAANAPHGNLSQTNLSQTNLSQTNLSQTNLSQTNLSQTNLSQTKPSQPPPSQAKPQSTSVSGWHVATREELASVIPARAPVGRERIETEMRTASGVTDGKGKSIAGVVLITAGYSADGKYSHFFLTQVPIQIGSFDLRPGPYVIGWKHQDDTLAVSFYDATTEKLLGTVNAEREAGSRVDSFRMTPPGVRPRIFIGRFSFAYHLAAN